MLRHDYLFNPVSQTETIPDADFLKYVKIREDQTGDTDPKLTRQINDQFVNACKAFNVDKDRQQEIWSFIGPKVATNAGLAQFILDYDGAKSQFFFPWLVNVYRSPSAALEMAYGAGEDLSGAWVTDVLDTGDPICFFVRNDPTFVYNRERQLYVADLAATSQDVACSEYLATQERGKIVDFGAGRLAWARWHGFEFCPEYQSIYAFDKDPSISMDEIFDGAAGELGIIFKQGDLTTELTNRNCQSAILVLLGGVVSYLPFQLFTDKIIPAFHAMLEPGGAFFFDLQLNCPYLQRSMKIFDWPEIDLYKDAASAFKDLEKARKKLWESGVKFSAEYALDTYNATPSAIMVTFTKIT